MNDLAVVVFDNELQAYQGSRALRELEREHKLTRYADAIVTRRADGKTVLCRRLRTGHVGTQMGLFMGGLVGLLRGPLGIAFGVVTGMLVGALLDVIARAGIRKEFLDAGSPHLLHGKAALVTEIDESSPLALDTRMKALCGEVFRRSGVPVESPTALHPTALARAGSSRPSR
jgi:uncharacterized membrane protein